MNARSIVSLVLCFAWVGCTEARLSGGAITDAGPAARPVADAGAVAAADAGARAVADAEADAGGVADAGADSGADAGVPSCQASGAGRCCRDMDCGPADYCTNDGRCVALRYPDAGPCPTGVTKIARGCKGQPNEAEFVACAGPPATADCPYCSGGACYQTGFCGASADCHGGETCNRGLCQPVGDPCDTFVSIDDIRAARYSPGKHVCVRGWTSFVVPALDGDTHVQLGINSDFGFTTEMTRPYRERIGNPPSLRQVTLYGAIRWDPGHGWWEVHPIFWWR